MTAFGDLIRGSEFFKPMHHKTAGCLAFALALVAYHATRYHSPMITSFRHKGLRKYYETGSLAGIQPAHANRLKMQLTALDTAQTIEDMDIPGFRLHPLKGSERGRWSIWVNGNWRVTFKFENGNAFILD
jgi:toxin HigB-1